MRIPDRPQGVVLWQVFITVSNIFSTPEQPISAEKKNAGTRSDAGASGSSIAPIV